KIELIASENFVSEAVMEAMGSVLTNKYAEGYPGKRYYGGCEHVDVAEILARDRAKQLFRAEHVNVQPYSGAQANMAVYCSASENFVAEAVMEAMGSVVTNKYAEGYPGKRYYGGCEHVDVAENLARDRAKQLFGAEHVNVQPHSGAQANMAVYFSVLEPGDTVLGMNLSHGGHLTHGSPVNFSGELYNFVEYGVDRETEQLDYDVVLEKAKEVHPKLIVAGASAYSREIDFAKFREIA